MTLWVRELAEDDSGSGDLIRAKQSLPAKAFGFCEGDLDSILSQRYRARNAPTRSVAAYYSLRDACPYEELGGDYFVRREDPERLARRLVRQLERLGQRVTLEPVAAEAR